MSEFIFSSNELDNSKCLYFTIKQVSVITNISLNRLRYIESSDSSFNVKRIKNRRYCSRDSLRYLYDKYAIDAKENDKVSNFKDLVIKISDSTLSDINSNCDRLAIRGGYLFTENIKNNIYCLSKEDKQDLKYKINNLIGKMTDLIKYMRR